MTPDDTLAVGHPYAFRRGDPVGRHRYQAVCRARRELDREYLAQMIQVDWTSAR
jgi:hypothetical protein